MDIYVIIPAYNAEKYLVEAVESVLNQPYKNINVIIVDDGSTDNTPAICDSLSTQYANVYCIHKTNGGVSSARNTGIEYVLSKENEKIFIAFLDADDKWNDNIIDEEIITRNSDSDIIVFGEVSANEDISRFSKPIIFQSRQYNKCGQGLIWSFNSHFASKFYSSEIISKYNICFDESLRYSEGQKFQLQCIFLSKKIASISGVLYIYRNSENSAMDKMRKIAPINYFTPIIKGWIESDKFINENSDKTCVAGSVLASIYFLEMVEFSCRISLFEGLRMINHLSEIPYYDIFVSMKQSDVSKSQFKNKTLLLSSPIKFCLKHRTNGIYLSIASFLFKFSYFKRKRLNQKYPYTEINN